MTSPVRILAVSDRVSDTLFNARVRERIGPVDLLLSCGDLPYTYLEYLVTELRTRHAYFVHGNHDAPEHCESGQTLSEPGGWENLDGRVTHVARLNLLVAGLEGCIRYRPGAPYQYAQGEMTWRAQPLMLQLLFNKIRYGRYLDIFIAHSPPAGIHDGPDGPHRGFDVFLSLMRRFRPRLLLHGHQHRYGPAPWRTRYAATEVVNIYPFRLIEWGEETLEYGRSYCG
ncbi:MAG: metallophosphoesterase [Chloroflexota bacterium]|nr:metallophosphoesterase [Chloroflexota bacterium]